IDEDPVIADPALRVLHDAIEDAGQADHADLEPALLGDLALDGLHGCLPQLHHAARQAPLARRGLAPTLDGQDALTVEHHGADADAGKVRILSHYWRGDGEPGLRRGWAGSDGTSRRASPRSHRGVAYFSLTSRSLVASSSLDSPSGLRRRPCSLSKASMRAS